ncbi:MAG: hypothetical protein ACRDK3_12230 [Actinomycetota bacterium]
MKRAFLVIVAGLAALALPATAFGHGKLDHAPPSFTQPEPLSTEFNSGGEGAEWDLVGTFATGSPHTDLDFFTQDGETFASVGTLGAGLNAGGQAILQLTENGEVTPDSLKFRSAHPSATCISDPSAALGLQHDVEASPKGTALLNAQNRYADRTDTQLIIDATDAAGRCHDQGVGGIADAPPGGLEIVDVTDVDDPVEIGLVSHIGEAHTVNVDPKRPHIVYAVTSDSVGVDSNGKRANENPSSSQRFNLDGFEVVDISSCMDFPAGTSVETKRAECRPEVYRYRYPSANIALGHTLKSSIYGCHELEVYANDRLTCGSGAAAILFNVRNAFDDNGTSRNYGDDTLRGTPLPCSVRESSTAAPGFSTGAKVTDCVVGANGADLTVPGWLDLGAPSLQGVKHLGSAHHQGRGAGGATSSAYKSDEDIDFNHEAELTKSGKYIISTDERGGGVVPPGASCSPEVDNKEGNGGLHVYRVGRLDKTPPSSAEEAFDAYARTPEGEKAIHRAPIRTQPQGSFCTAHVFQQIPGQNRIFMGWYTQGTQVIDFIEHKDGTFEFEEAGFFIPENANTWTSHIFKVENNGDGTFTYYGATGDFFFGTAGRNAIDVYKVTLPAPPGTKLPKSMQASAAASTGDSGPLQSSIVRPPAGYIFEPLAARAEAGLLLPGAKLAGFIVLMTGLSAGVMQMRRRRVST